MSANKTDIVQIRKYLSGELDATAMHELERQALDDPFLMDALEGYERTNQNQDENLERLNNRLQQRIVPSKKRDLWPAIAVAASVLLILSVGGLWLFHDTGLVKPNSGKISSDRIAVTTIIHKPKIPVFKNSPPNEKLTVLRPAYSQPEVKHRSSAATEVLADQMEQSLFDTLHLADTRIAKMAAKDSTPKANALSEVVVVGYATQKTTEITGSTSVVNAEPLQNSLQGRAPGINVAGKADKSLDTVGIRLVTGQVLSKTDGKPMPGVSVSVLGKNRGVLTDATGRFNIQLAKQDELNIAYIGFKQEQVKVKEMDSLKVSLEESQTSLAEVVVVSNSNQEKIKLAHPVTGWDNFNHYLDDNTRSPDGKTGTVRLTFIVNPDNSLSGFKIIKSLSVTADQHAIELVKKGPSWIHNQNGKPEMIKINVHF